MLRAAGLVCYATSHAKLSIATTAASRVVSRSLVALGTVSAPRASSTSVEPRVANTVNAASVDAARGGRSGRSGRERLVIVGTGWAGFSLVQRIDKAKFDVTVVSLRNHFLFTPLLASTATGTLEFRSIIHPIREVGKGFRDEADFHCATVQHVDSERKVLRCVSAVDGSVSYELAYDKLVLAHGASPNTFGTPGVLEHALFLKELHQAREVRRRLLANIELASESCVSAERKRALLNVCIVGAGPTGVELASEIYDLLSQDLRRLYPVLSKDLRVTLIEGQNILTMFASNLRTYAERKIAARAEMRLVTSRVVRVNADSVDVADGTRIPCSLVVWTAGIGPSPLTLRLREAGWAISNHRLRTDDCLRVEGRPDVYAVGDCATMTTPLPQTAQVAETQGAYLADVLSGRVPAERAYRFVNRGLMAYIGGFDALAELAHPSNTPSSDLHTRSAKIKGLLSFMIWRSAYLTKLGSWRLRLQVPIDWTKTLLFGRDISRF